MMEEMKIDLYELLDVGINAEEREIKKAYRKKALTCHPDKNPDNPKAAELFQQLSKALEILTDTSARIAYDKVLKARKASILRNKELDSKRKKLKEDLETREQLNKEKEAIDDAAKLQKEIERLRKEGSKLLEEEKMLLRQQIESEKLGLVKQAEDGIPRLKIKWKRAASKDEDMYTQEELQRIFEKYGIVVCIALTKKRESAIVEFDNFESAKLAFESEKGHPDRPLTITWLSSKQEKHNFHKISLSQPKLNDPPISQDSTLTSRDYESLVFMKLRQAEERKRLIQQMMEEDESH